MTNEQVMEIAEKLNVAPNTVESMVKQLNYRKLYNQRPEVREKRAAYNKARNAKMKVLKALLSEAL